jgi:hypothetical protein
LCNAAVLGRVAPSSSSSKVPHRGHHLILGLADSTA